MLYCTFFLKKVRFGIPALNVREIVSTSVCTPVPNSRSDILGLINIRGQIIAVVDLKRMLGLKPACFKSNLPIILLKTESELYLKPCDKSALSWLGAEETIAILTDGIEDLVEVDDNTMIPVPANTGSLCRDYLHGVVRDQKGMIIVLDLGALFGTDKLEPAVYS